MKFKLLLIILLAVSFNSFGQFTNLPGPPGGNMNDLEFDPISLKVYTVVNNSLYVSTNDGTTWTKVVQTTPTNLYIGDFMVDGTTLFALYYYQLYSSTDGGANWTRINTNGSFDGAYKIIKVATGTYAVYGYNGVYVSKDAGVNWVQISTVYAISAVANANGDLFFSDTDGIKRHINPGPSAWSSASVSIATTTSADYDLRLAVINSPAGSGTLFANIYNGGSPTLVKIAGSAIWPSTVSTSGVWTAVKSNITDGSFYGTWAVSSANLYFVNNGYNKIYSTAIGATAGATWTISTVWPSGAYGNSQVNDLRFATASKAFVGTSGDGVFLTTNTGTSWSLATGGIYLADAYDVIVTGTVGSFPRVIVRTGYSSKGFWYSDDKGATWSFSTSMAQSVSRITKMASGTLLGLGNTIQYSTNSGVVWTTGTDYFEYSTYNATFNSGYVYAITSNRLASSTTGSTWTTITVTGLPASYYPYYGMVQDNAGHIYAVVYNYSNSKYELYKIILAGNSASATTATAYKLTLTLLPNDQSYFSPTGIVVNNNKLYIGTYSGIYVSSDVTTTTDGSGTFNSIVFSNYAIMGLPNANGICASTYGALYVTSDDGLTWSDNALPSSDGYIRALAYDNTNTIYYGGGYNTPALKDVASTLIPASPPAYINFNWAATNGPWGGPVSKIMVDNASNSFAFSNNSNTTYKTSTFTSWSAINPLPQSNYLYAIDMDKPNSTLYGLTYNQLYTSANGGTTWTLKNGSENFGYSYNMKFCSNGDVAMVTGDKKIYVSTNGGTTFGTAKYTFASTNYVYRLLTTSTATPGLFVEYYDNNSSTTNIKRSTDRGVTWNDLTMPSGQYNSISTAGANVYVSMYDNINGYYNMFKSTDNGTTWTSIKGDLSGSYYLNYVYVAPTSEIYMTGYNSSLGQQGMYKSTNGGTNWTWIQTAAFNVNDINWVGTRMVIATDQGVYTSDDAGATFISRSTGIPFSYLNGIQLVSPSKLYAINGSQNFVSTDFQNWSTATNSFLGFTRKPDGTLLAFDNTKLYQTSDGNTWTTISGTLPYLNSVTTSDGTTYYGITYNKIYYSNDLATWTALNPTGLPAQFGFNDIAVDQNGIVYVTLSNYSNGYAQEAYQILFGNGIKISQPKNPINVEFSQNKIYLYDQNGAIFTTTDGSSWTKLSAPGGDKLIIASLNYYFIPSYGGNLWLSRDQGQTWQNVGLGSSNSNYNFSDVAVNEYNGYAYGAVSGSPVRKSQNIVIPSDIVAPAVTGFSPVNNSTGVSLKPSLSVTFDQATVAVAGKYLRIIDLANTTSPVEIIDVSVATQSGKTFTFKPVNFLAFNKTYFISIDNGAFADIFGNNYAGFTSSTIWRFTTKLAPTLNTLSPANAATNVSVTPALSMTFSEGMNVVSGKNLYIYDASQTSTPYTTVTANIPVNDFATIIPPSASPDQAVTVIFDANKGGGELIGATKVYMHAGAVTGSVNSTSWNYTVGNWGNDDGVGQMTAVPGSPNVWQITLSPTLRQYFSISSGATIYRLAMTFRNANGNLKATPPATVTGGSLAPNNDLFFNLGTTVLPSVYSINNTVNVFSPTPLQFGKQYFVKWDATSFQTAQEGYGLSFDVNNTDWVFNTRSAPTISVLAPANSSTSATLNTSLAITLSEAFTLVNGKNLNVYKTSAPGAAVATVATNSGSISGNKLTVSLSSPLEFNTQYFVLIDAGAFKAVSDGGTFSVATQNTDWTFTTRAAPTVSTSPANNATGVLITTQLTITFSELLTPVATKNLNVSPGSIKVLVTSGTVSGNSITYTLPSALSYLTQYSVTLDANSFTSADGGSLSLLQSNTSWVFTTIEAPDTTPPVITFTAPNFNKGATNTLQVTITDNKSVASAKVSYRGVLSTGAFTDAALTLNNATSKWEVAVADTWLDAMGLEYYITATDPSSNQAVLPATPSTYFDSYIAFPSSANPQIPTSQVSFGGKVTDYRIISVPYKLTDSNITTIFSELGSADNTKYRILTYAGNNAWSEYPTDFAVINRGTGYWINMVAQTNLLIDGSTTPNDTKTSEFSITLKPGYNEIGNPYPFEISWESVKTSAGNTNIGKVKKYSGSFADGDKIKAFEGGFVFLNGTSNATVKIPFSSATGGRIASPSNDPFDSRGWLMPLSLQQGDLTNTFGGVGMHPDASLSYDQFDDVPLPKFFDYLEMSFNHPEHFAKYFNRDVVPVQEDFSWEFSVSSNQPGLTVLSWPIPTLQGNKEIYLLDESLQRLVNMANIDGYSFDHKVSSKFKIFYGSDLEGKIRPQKLLLGDAYPNPTNSATSIPFTLPDQAGLYQVNLEVFDGMGRKVNTLVNDQLPSGFYVTSWDSSPGNLSEGLYIYRLNVSGSNGLQTMSGKIVLKR